MTYRRLGLGAGAILAAAFFAVPVGAGGPAGSSSDLLNSPGSPTDRYLEPAEVREVLHAANDRFYQCFRTHLRGGGEPGNVAVTFTIDRSGRASSAVAEMAAGYRSLAGCLTGLVQALEFGEHDGEPLQVSYPLVYQVDRKGARVVPYPTVFVRPDTVRLPLLTLPPDLGPGELRMLEIVLFGGDLDPRSDRD